MSTLSKRAWALDLLGLDANATVDEIKTAYRDLVLIWHPDKHQSNARNLKRAEEMIKRLNAAREVLIDNGEIPSDWASESARTKQEEPKQEEKREEKKKEKPNDTKDGREKRQKVDEPFIQDERSAERDYVKVSVGAVKQVIKFLKMRWGMTYDYFSRGKGLVYVFLPLSIILILSGTCEKVTRQMSVIVADKSKQTTLENQSALETNQEYENNTKATNNMEALLRNVEKNKKGLAELRILTDYGTLDYEASIEETAIIESASEEVALNLLNKIQAYYQEKLKEQGIKKKRNFTPSYQIETMNEAFQKTRKVNKNEDGLAAISLLTAYGTTTYIATLEETKTLETGTLDECLALINRLRQEAETQFAEQGLKRKTKRMPPYQIETVREAFQKSSRPKF